jgi:hypothetical protein
MDGLKSNRELSKMRIEQVVSEPRGTRMGRQVKKTLRTKSKGARASSGRRGRIEDETVVDVTKGVVKTVVPVLALTGVMGAVGGLMNNGGGN